MLVENMRAFEQTESYQLRIAGKRPHVLGSSVFTTLRTHEKLETVAGNFPLILGVFRDLGLLGKSHISTTCDGPLWQSVQHYMGMGMAPNIVQCLRDAILDQFIEQQGEKLPLDVAFIFDTMKAHPDKKRASVWGMRAELYELKRSKAVKPSPTTPKAKVENGTKAKAVA